ncbi:MAG TPA: hypothetical protein VFB29_04835 [Pseudolabrys sp.]|nr:hypothetical protein [Pseudolabrys sp.]
MPHLLDNLKITELSLVDNPANPFAKVSLFKRADDKPANPLLKGRRQSVVETPSAKPPKGSPVRRDSEAEQRLERARRGTKATPAEERRLAQAFDDDDEDETMPKDFEAAVNKIAARAGSKTAAMREARARHPDLYAKYQAETADLVAKAQPQPVEKSDSIKKFEQLVDRVQSRDGCSRLEALTRAAREHPEAREAYASALS